MVMNIIPLLLVHSTSFHFEANKKTAIFKVAYDPIKH